MVLSGITLFDALLSSVYLILILYLGYRIKANVKLAGPRKMLIPFIVFKIVCVLAFVLLHIFVYKGGDTFLFFAGGKFIAYQITQNPQNILNLLFGGFESFENLSYSSQYGFVYDLRDPTTLFTSKICAVFCLLSFNQFLATTLLYTMASSIGVWALYMAFCKLYPNLYWILSLCILFYPTLGIWSSGILKDPIVLAAIGLIFNHLLKAVKERKYVFNIGLVVISIFVCLYLKPYILYTLIPALVIWLQPQLLKNTSKNILQFFINPILTISFFVAGFFFLQTISAEAGKYSLENLQSMAKGFQQWHTYLAETRNQTGYSLGEIEFTTFGLISKIPEAIFVTFYRPLPFEVNNFAMALESLESTILLVFTLFIFFKIGLFTFIKTLLKDQNIRAFMLFALLLGIAVGFTSYNFGALSRYKIPCIPFFTASLVIIYYKARSQRRLRI